MPRANAPSDTATGLLAHFANTGVGEDHDDTGIDVWDEAWGHHDHEECQRCHNENGDDHGPRECPYGGCDPGEHCPWECPYETGHTDWDHVYPQLGPHIHRGMSLHLPDHDPHAEPEHIARHITDHLEPTGAVTHWTDNPHQARHYAQVSRRSGDNLHVVLHGGRPARGDIETDPRTLLEHDVIGYGLHEDNEIPLQSHTPVHLTGISWRAPGHPEWHRHDFGSPIRHIAGAAERARFAPGPGENANWDAGHDRIVRGLSTGQLHIDDAEKIGYRADSRQHPDPTDLTRGWQSLPRRLWHTTTNLTGAKDGLKTRSELGMRHGHGLGGGPDDMISLTDSREHAHRMLAALHDYHDVLTGRTPLTELDRRARAGEGASRPYADHTSGLWLPYELSSVMRGQRHVQDFQAVHDARAAGLHPHPDTHTNFGPGLDGREYAVGWERPATPEELSHDRSEYYHSHMNARRQAGGERPVLFMANHAHALAQRDPADFAVLHVTPRPGAQGWRVPGEHEWRTGTGDALHVRGVDPTPLRQTVAMPSASHPRPPGFISQLMDSSTGRRIAPDQEPTPGRSYTLTGFATHRRRKPVAVTSVNYHLHDTGQHISVGQLWTHPREQHKGYASALMDDMYARHPQALIDHGGRTPAGQGWWDQYTDPDPDRSTTFGTNSAASDADSTSEHTAAKAWLPHDRFFGPGKPGLDPRLFDGDHLKPTWRKALYHLAARALNRYGPEWHSWARVYLAGSQASHWYGNNDLDVLLGINYDLFRSADPARAAMGDAAIDEMLNASAHKVCDPARYFDIDGEHTGPWDSTVYINHDSYDISRIKPYAAYDLTDDRWAVRPVEVPDDFGPESLPSADFKYARSLADQVKALKKLPREQAQSLGSALYDQLHGQRHEAFTGTGQGLYDPRNVAWKYLDQHPGKPMEQLVNWKRATEQSGPGMTITSVFERPTLPNPDAEYNEGARHDEWFHGTPHLYDHPEVDEDREWDNQGHHWNTGLGTHWTARHAVAHDFADRGAQRIFHARLHLANPKRYKSEYDMDRDVYGHEYDEGNHPSVHDESHQDVWEGHPWLGHEKDLRPLRAGDRGTPRRRRFQMWLSSHPDRQGIAERFKQRLTDQGHDGITYGNEFEHDEDPDDAHQCAIAFHPRQVEITQVHHRARECLTGHDLEDFQYPRPGQPTLPGMHNHPGLPDNGGLEHLAGKDGTSDADFAKSSMMIALVPPRTLADGLQSQVEDGEPADQMHVTLAYLPHVAPGDTGRIAGVVAEWASRFAPPVCRVQGSGTFVNIGNHPMWAAVDIPGSSRLHSTLVDALKAAGFAPAEEHGFTAHLTLKYQKHHVRFLPKIEPTSFTCHTVWVCRGADWRPVPFGGSTAK